MDAIEGFRFKCDIDVHCKTRDGEWKTGQIQSLGKDAYSKPGYLVLFKDNTCQFVQDDPKICKRVGGVPWFEAVRLKDLAKLQAAEVSSVDHRNRERTALLACAEEGWEIGVRWLLGRKAWRLGPRVEPSAGDSQGRTALHAATQHGHRAIMATLLEANADVNAKEQVDDDDELYDENIDGRDLFFGITKRPSHPETCLHRAASQLDAEACRLLLRHRADVDGLGPKDQTPLHLVEALPTSERQLAIAALLLREGGADPNLRNRERGVETASLMSAVLGAKPALAVLLLQHRADVDARGGTTLGGMTALHMAARKRNEALVVRLVEARADVSVVNGTGVGKTAAEVARANGSEHLAAFIEGTLSDGDRAELIQRVMSL